MQIYKILNKINNKIYIGKDTTDNPVYMGSGVLIKLAIIKYGLENFEKTIICETEDKKELSHLEKYWIMFYKSTDRTIGYNISDGGDGGDTLTNHPDIDKIKIKMSKSMKNRILSTEHIENLSRNHFSRIGRSGKTYEEIYGKNKADVYREKLRNARKKYTSERESLGENYDSEIERKKLRFEGINNPMSKNKYSWYHNTLNGKTLRLIEGVDEIPDNYKKGRGPKKW
jgi:hypothetical protein